MNLKFIKIEIEIFEQLGLLEAAYLHAYFTQKLSGDKEEIHTDDVEISNDLGLKISTIQTLMSTLKNHFDISTECKKSQKFLIEFSAKNQIIYKYIITRVRTHAQKRKKINTYSFAIYKKKKNAHEETPQQKYVKKFYEKIPINLKNVQVQAQAKKLQLWQKRNNIPNVKLKNIMRWYVDQFDKEKFPYCQKYLPMFMPQAISIPGFIQKFDKIESAYLKSKLEISNQPKTEKIILSANQKKIETKLKSIFAKLDYDHATLPKLIRELSNWQKEIKIKIAKLPNEIKKLYDDFANDRRVFDGYAMWLVSEVENWPSWNGNLETFHPGNKHHKNFIKQQAKKRGLNVSRLGM